MCGYFVGLDGGGGMKHLFPCTDVLSDIFLKKIKNFFAMFQSVREKTSNYIFKRDNCVTICFLTGTVRNTAQHILMYIFVGKEG